MLDGVFRGISSASVLGRIALGRRAGARVWRLGHDPDAPWITSSGPRQAHFELEQLCRYLFRPPVAQDLLRLTGDGRVLLTLKTPWADGTRRLLFGWRP